MNIVRANGYRSDEALRAQLTAVIDPNGAQQQQQQQAQQQQQQAQMNSQQQHLLPQPQSYQQIQPAIQPAVHQQQQQMNQMAQQQQMPQGYAEMQQSATGHNIDPAIAGASHAHHALDMMNVNGDGGGGNVAIQRNSGGRSSGGETDDGGQTQKQKKELASSKRAAQNRAAQRAFRQRKETYIKALESKVREAHQQQETFAAIQDENFSLRDYIIRLQNHMIAAGCSNEAPQPSAMIAEVIKYPRQAFDLRNGERDPRFETQVQARTGMAVQQQLPQIPPQATMGQQSPNQNMSPAHMSPTRMSPNMRAAMYPVQTMSPEAQAQVQMQQQQHQQAQQQAQHLQHQAQQQQQQLQQQAANAMQAENQRRNDEYAAANAAAQAQAQAQAHVNVNAQSPGQGQARSPEEELTRQLQNAAVEEAGSLPMPTMEAQM